MGQSGWKELHKRIIVVLYNEKDSDFLNKTNDWNIFTKVGNVAYVYEGWVHFYYNKNNLKYDMRMIEGIFYVFSRCQNLTTYSRKWK